MSLLEAASMGARLFDPYVGHVKSNFSALSLGSFGILYRFGILDYH